ncbi:MAG: peptide chain release factor N(5)-glutamine methyltransferase [Wenzhouxiangellaceae bacterium]|nr:peptide chain release factor N(5)-glutamine methyltransferase [Wenzhouxiangellaceae bacterium]
MSSERNQLQLTDWLASAGRRLGDRSEALALAALALERDRAWLFAHGDHRLNAAKRQRLDALLQRRINGEPVAYLAGRREFFGREFIVSPAVLIPRPETEHLIEFALTLDLPDDARVADIGTGSGCIALTLAAERPGWRCTGSDISQKALAIAARNRQALDLARVELLHGDGLQPLASNDFDLIVSNPPYVAEGDPHLERGDLVHEPTIALTPGGDGLAVLRRLITEAPARLSPGGWLALEHGHDQAASVRHLFECQAYADVRSICDLAGIERITVGRIA